MKKKLLSLLLVLCMLLPMIPVGVISAFAEEETLPSSTLTPDAVTLPAEEGGKVTLPDGWSFVAHGAQQHPNTTAPHNGYETTYVLDTYVTGGIYCTLTAAENGTDKDFAASWSDGKVDGINGIDATRLPVICFNSTQGPQINMGVNACVVYTGGYAYEAPSTGYITIELDNVATGGGTQAGGWGGFGDTLVALFVGGEMVWPAGGSYDDRATWYNLNGNGGQNKADLVNNGATVEDIFVEAGQAVEFLVFHSWWDNSVRADMTVAYTEAYTSDACTVKIEKASGIESHIVEAGEQLTLPAYDGAGLFRGWDANGDGEVDYAANSTIIVNNSMTLTPVLLKAVFDRSNVSVGEDCKVILPAGFGLVTRSANNYATKYDVTTLYNGGEKKPTTGVTGESWFLADELWWGDAHISWQNKSDSDWCWGAYMGLGATSNWNIGYTYTASATGYVDISIDRIVDLYMNNTDSWANPNKYIAFFVNGAMVWPTAGGSYTNAADWEPTSDNMSAAALDQSLLEHLFVKEGDTIELLAKSSGDRGDAVYVGWSVNYTSAVDENSYLVEVLDNTGYRLDVYIVESGNTVTLPSYDNGKVAFVGWDVNGDGYADYVENSTITVTGNVTAKAVMATSSFNRNDSAITLDENYQVVLPDGWSLIAHNANNYADTKALTTVYDGASMNPGTAGEGGWIIDPTIDGWGWGGSPRIPWLNKGDRPDYHGAYLGLGPNKNWNAGYVYTAEYTGYVDININEIVYADQATNQGWGTRKYLAVFVDGAMVWPTKGGSYTNEADWISAEKALTDTNLSLLKGIHVEMGDKVEVLAKSNDVADAVYVGWSVNYTDFEPVYVKVQTPDIVTIPAVPGQQIKLPNYTGNELFLGWDANGDGTIDYADKATITMPNTKLLELTPVLAVAGSTSENLPTVDKITNAVTYKNGWKIGLFDVVGGKFLPYTLYSNSYICNDADLLKGGLCIDVKSDEFGTFVMPSMGGYNATLQYTAEMSGYITIDFNELAILRTLVEGEEGKVAGGIEIYINGVLYASASYASDVYAEAGTYTDNGALMADILAQLEDKIPVLKGDVIEFRLVQGNAKTNAAVIDPMISWEDVSFAPEVSATGVTIGRVQTSDGEYVEGFALNVYATLNAPRMDYFKSIFVGNEPTVVLYYISENGDVGMVPASWMQDNTASNSAFANVTYMFQLPAMNIKELSTASYRVVVVMAYQDGTKVSSADFDFDAPENSGFSTWDEVSAEAYVYNATVSNAATTQTKQAAAALLNYAAAADMYFDGESDIMIPDVDVKLPTVEPEDVYNMTEFDGKAKITGATLNIDETISMIIYLDADVDINGWRLQMDDDDSFSSPKSMTISKRRGGGYMVEVTISTANFGDAFYFRVVDNHGEQQSGVLTYSVESYVARMYQNDDADQALLNLLDAMLVVCKIGNSMR